MAIVYVRHGQPVPKFTRSDLVVYVPPPQIEGKDVSQQRMLAGPLAGAIGSVMPAALTPEQINARLLQENALLQAEIQRLRSVAAWCRDLLPSESYRAELDRLLAGERDPEFAPTPRG